MRTLVCYCLPLLLVNGPTRLFAGEEEQIQVQLLSGRTFVGELDQHTSAKRLWLRSGDAAAHVLRPIDWERVKRVRMGERTLTVPELQAQVAQRPEAPEAASNVIEDRGPPRPANGSIEKAATKSPPDAPRVESLAVDASLANWDSDVEVDGLWLSVAPLDGWGRVVPVSGMLEVELRAERRFTQTRGEALPSIGRWTVAVSAEDVASGAASYRLPFQEVHPEYDTSVLRYGQLHARLIVPGHGVFEAESGVVRIRAFSPLRDRQQQLRGTRFFPGELTGRGAAATNNAP